MRVLYVDDSKVLRDTVSRGLRKAGFAVDLAEDGPTALDIALVGEYAVVVLDVMLPGKDGFEVLRELRESGNQSQIMMLTARVEIADRVRGLESGADDYLVKPFAWEEFLARIRTLVRRRYRQPKDLLELGNLRIDLRARRAWVGQNELVLRPREFGILEYLGLRGGQVVTRTEILEEVYDHSIDLKSNAIDAAVCNLRKLLADEGVNDAIKTIPRRGYLMEKRIRRDQDGNA